MQPKISCVPLEAAKADLRKRTLSRLDCDFARVIYLSSLRDFNTGQYHHQGLAHTFTESVASTAMAECHHELFKRLVLSPLRSFVEQLDRFIRSSPNSYENTLVAWKTLEGYHVAIPSNCDPLTAELFRSNVRIAMELLRIPPQFLPQPARPASQLLSLGQ
jgi:hypothetical protein